MKEYNNKMLKQVQHDEEYENDNTRHPEFISGSHEQDAKMLKQVQHDVFFSVFFASRHSELVSESLHIFFGSQRLTI